MTSGSTKKMSLFSRSIFLVFLLSAPVYGESLQCRFLPTLFKLFLKNHYTFNDINKKLRKNTVEQFIKSLDSSKTLLYQKDIPKLRKNLLSIFDTMNKGKCDALNEVSVLLVKRAKENEDIARKVLGKKYKLDESVELVIDPKKRKYPKNLKQKKEILKKMIHFQMQNYLLAEMKMAEAKKQLIHRYELATKRLKEQKLGDSIEDYAAAFSRALDPHSSYLSEDDMEDFKIHMQLSLEGIGASLSSQDGFTVIEAILPGGGAERVNELQTKDKIIAVAQGKKGKPVSIIDMELREVVKLIRGKKGTKVVLTILRQAEETKTFKVTITRDKIDLTEKAAKIRYVNRKLGKKDFKIGVLELPSFYGGDRNGRTSSVDVKKLLLEANRKKVDGLVLDLSRNGGGILEEAVKISGFFINKGNVVATKDTRKTRMLKDNEAGVVYAGPLVVLTSRISASGAEILAGALKDYNRAVIVGGDHTFGKGSVQSFSPLPLGMGGMKVTMGLFFLPAGFSTQERGVISHIKLPSVLNDDDLGEKSLDYALEPQSIKAFVSKEANSSKKGHRWEAITKKTVKKLSKNSTKRIKKDPKFDEIRKSIEKREKNVGTIKLADIRKDHKEDKKKDKDAAKSKNKKKKSKKLVKQEEDKEYLDSAYIKESVNILIDLIAIDGDLFVTL